MDKSAYIISGISGSGKGTQTKLLNDYFLETGKKSKTFSTGEQLRHFIKKEESQFVNKVKDVFCSGGLLPTFIPTWLWSEFLYENLEKNDVFIFDGVARKFPESHILISALEFLEIKNIKIIHLIVSEEEVTKRLLKRGRGDDTEESIKERIVWYKDEVLKNIETFKNHKSVSLYDIDGTGDTQEIHKRIKETIKI